MRSLIGTMAADFRQCWKPLFVTDVIYKAIKFILLTPLVAILFRVLIALSGNAVLADQDILFFFLAPAGWICIILVGALWMGIQAIEMAGLMAVLTTTNDCDQHAEPLVALRFATSKAWPVVQVTAYMLGWTLLCIAPFLAVAAAVYFGLLTDYDINYYLKEKPPAFFVALFVAVTIMVTLVIVLLRLFTGWFFALPLVLFEDIQPSRALHKSRERAHGHRSTLLLWVLGWFLASSVLLVVTSSIVVGLGRFFVPSAIGSLAMLTIAIGMTLVVWSLVSLIVNLLGSTTFATMFMNLYRHLGSGGRVDVRQIQLADATMGQLVLRLSRNRILAAGILGIGVAAVIGVLAIGTVRLDDDVAIIAHRGSSIAAPENTLAAVRKAIEDGADWVEIDVQETVNGAVVVFHDSDFMKLAGVELKIWDATLDDLKKIDVGSWFATDFKDERVPTLGEVLDLCNGKVNVNIELKYYGHDNNLEQRVVDIVEAHDMAANVIYMSLKMDAVRKMKSIRPNCKVGMLMSVSAGNIRQIPADFLAVNAAFTDRSFVRAAHAIDKDVYVWTVNDAVAMSKMISLGVDGVITDKPALLRSVLEQRAQLGAAERLLLELASTFGVPTKIGEQ